jgi:hypothetical protein
MMVNGESESGEDEKGRKKVEEGDGMVGFRPGKKRGKSWGEGAATTSLGFCRTPSFLCKYLFFFVGFRVMAFSWGFMFVLFVHTLRSIFIMQESLHV